MALLEQVLAPSFRVSPHSLSLASARALGAGVFFFCRFGTFLHFLCSGSLLTYTGSAWAKFALCVAYLISSLEGLSERVRQRNGRPRCIFLCNVLYTSDSECCQQMAEND